MDAATAPVIVARTQTLAVVCGSGRLSRSPYSGTTYEAELTPWPLAHAHEYRSVGVFEKPSQEPVLLSPSQRDRWLGQIVSAARQQMPWLTLTVIRMGGPQAQLPALLLDKDVLLTHEPEASVARVLACGRREVLEIWHDIRTDGVEEGENRLVLTLHATERASAFVDFLNRNSVTACVEGLSITGDEAEIIKPGASSGLPERSVVVHAVGTEPAECEPPRIELLAALHWNIVPPFAQGNPELASQIDVIGRCIAAQARAVAPAAAWGTLDFMMSSTVISGAISGLAPVSQQLFDVVQRHCGRRPSAFLHTYMCAGWGYAFSHLLRHTDSRMVLLSIVDVDIHDLAYHRGHALIGKMGFGISTLLLRIPACRADMVQTAGPFAGSAFKEFILAMKLHNAKRSPVLSFIPFFDAGLSSIAEKIIGKANLGENCHEVYGHCFGSDAWIGIIEWLQKNPIAEPINVTAGTVALSGYFALSDIGIAPETRIGLQVIGGSESELEAAMSEPPILRPAGTATSNVENAS
jgi:hypothetical protein